MKILMLYNIIQQLVQVDIPKSDLIPALDYYCTRSQETIDIYIQPFARTDVYYYSFFPSAIRICMELSPPKKL